MNNNNNSSKLSKRLYINLEQTRKDTSKFSGFFRFLYTIA